ncbi:hypothetical protein OG871_35305 [Kitasatospora sp. NBC_00374]|uniref:hypothetical protein n=1 Tax=Kitasatospora sp. NBC_00374 TaxID=2975964 RepID=UPI003248C0CB
MALRSEARVDVSLEAWTDPEGAAAPAGGAPDPLAPGVLFAPALRADTTRKVNKPNVVWQLTGAWAHEGKTATGTAAVYYGLEPDGTPHEGLVNPMVFADGFNFGESNLDDLYAHLNAPYGAEGRRLLGQLQAAGVDIVLLGFKERHTYIQANAGVAVSAIRKAIADRQPGGAPLIVGGVSMGGLITRYALARMENEGEEHETGTYLSYDSPHNGAWIPVALQQLAYFFESVPDPSGNPKQAELIRSPAAQQLLWAWVENARDSGAVATWSKLRRDFLQDLKDVGWFPSKPGMRRIGVANGTGDTIGGPVQPDEEVFDWTRPGLARAVLRTQPAFGQMQEVVRMSAVLLGYRTSRTSEIPPLDGAPGGTLASYGMLADALGATIDERHRSGCFVPSVSAVALKYDPVTWDVDLKTDLNNLPAGRSDLDAFCCDTTNSEHSLVTETLAEWILAALTD